MIHMKRVAGHCLLTIIVVLCSARGAIATSVDVTYSPEIADTYTGRVYLLFKKGWGEPRFGPGWFEPEPLFSIDVEQWKPGEILTFDDEAHSFPNPLSELPDGTWKVQALMRLNLDSPALGGGVGNAYSKNNSIDITKHSAATFNITIDRVTEAPPLPPTGNWSLAEMKSPLLSEFHGRPMTMRAIVLLPEEYATSGDRKYPTLYWVGGFGSNHLGAFQFGNMWRRTVGGDSVIRVVLDPLCFGGHHVFADSANNGPRAQALIKEFIPYLEQTYRVDPNPESRFLAGASSGGWSTLWLQVKHPDSFGGVWSLCPDPVDFRAFQQVNLYAPEANLFRTPDGQRSAVARANGQNTIYTDNFVNVENVLGDGGQMRSFEWVFSPRGEDGKPLRMSDPTTGEVNPSVVEAWREYDIQLYLRAHWNEIKDKLAKKITIIVGTEDTFYLDGAVVLLAETLQELGSDAQVEILEGEDHSSFINRRLFDRIDRELLHRYNAQEPAGTTSD